MIKTRKLDNFENLKLRFSMTSMEGFTRINDLGAQRIPFLCITDFKGDQVLVWPLDDLSPQNLRFEINGRSNDRGKFPNSSSFQWNYQAPAYKDYQRAFNKVQHHLRRGDSYLLNLTFTSALQTNLSLLDIYRLSNAKYKLWFKDQFVVFSPETFVRIKDGLISSYPMKGTMSDNIPGARQKLLDNEKELEEHYTIVDLIRNDLGRVATDIHVDRFRYLDLIKTSHEDLWQVSSKITGKLSSDYPEQLGTLLQELIPAGSISGAPKKRTVELIEGIESHKRRFFTGIVGLFDGQNFDSGVMIRFVEKNGQGLLFKSGGGITVNSKVRSEYQEMIDKIYVPII